MRHKRGDSRKFSNYEKSVSMESPFERLQRHDDHAHSGRDFPREAGAAKANAKLGSSTKDQLWGLAGGLETSNLRGNVNWLRVIFLFRLLEDERILLGPGGPRAGPASGTYSTRPSSTTSDIFTPGLDAVSEECHHDTSVHWCL